MSRTHNTITKARGGIAENARRQLSLMRSSYARLLPKGRKNLCRMSRTVKNHSLKREQSKFYLLCRA